MKTLAFLLLSLVILSACALVQKRVEVQWPTDLTYLEGEGDLDMSWRKQKYHGSFILQMVYPDILHLEVYGPFGQTLVYVKKEANRFLFVAGEEKSTEESAFQDTYGLEVRQIMDDLALKGQAEATPDGGLVLQRKDYRVVYGQDRARRKTCWEGRDGTICMTFNEISFEKK